MKQIFTLFVMGMLCLCASKTFAQINQGFEPVSGVSPLTSLTSNCWSFFNSGWDNSSEITGTGSFYAKPTGAINITTPFIDFQNGNVISLKYKLSNKLANSANRIIALSLLDRNGTSTPLTSITLDNSSASKTVFTLTYTITAATPGTQRLVIDVKGAGDGNTAMYIDDISVVKNPDPLVTVNPAFHYSPSNCNSAPVAGDNTYNATSNGSYSGTTVLSNDSDPNSESLTAAVATQSLDGTVLMNLDGTFTFTPNAGFTGSFTSFTYTVTDNGYNTLSSTASVYIYFPQVSTLPIQLIHFTGVAATKANLAWSVASNETGRLFEVQRSSNGGAFQSIATVFATENSGEAQYQYADALSAQATTYRLKIVNKDGTFFYSPVVSFKAAAATSNVTLLQNPVQNTLRFTVAATTQVRSIAIYNMAGTVVYNAKIEKSNNTITLPLQANLLRGTYVLQVVTDSGTKTATFIKQ